MWGIGRREAKRSGRGRYGPDTAEACGGCRQKNRREQGLQNLFTIFHLFVTAFLPTLKKQVKHYSQFNGILGNSQGARHPTERQVSSMTYPNDNFNDRNFTTGNTDLPTGEYRYDKDCIHQDAASGQAQQTAASGYHPSDANKKSTGRGKKGTALLLAGCLVLSMVGGAGGAVIAAKSGLLGTGSTVLYQGVEVPSTNGSTVGVSYSGVVQQVEDSVVAITTESVATNYFFRQYVTQGAGSGVVLTADGYIVTNYHVIKGAQQITVTANDGSTYAATLVGTDEDNDIAVLKVDAKDLTPAILGDSDTLKVGDAVLAIGNPLGTLSGTVTDGIVSALERQVTIDGNNMTLLQTSAAVNPGNSGGGLFNANGELIGIVNAKSTSDSSGNAVDNIGFAIPINSVKTIIEDLISHGYVTGQIVLGVSLVDITDERTARYYGLDSTGVYIQSVESGSIADKGGLQAGDRLLSFGGVEVSTADELKAALAAHSVGDRVEIKVSRNGREYTHSVVLTEYVPSSATN